MREDEDANEHIQERTFALQSCSREPFCMKETQRNELFHALYDFILSPVLPLSMSLWSHYITLLHLFVSIFVFPQTLIPVLEAGRGDDAICWTSVERKQSIKPNHAMARWSTASAIVLS